MNFEEALRETAESLQSEYSNYDVAAARQVLEDRILAAEMPIVLTPAAHPHPSTMFARDPSASEHEDWRANAACAGEDMDQFYTRGVAQRRARVVCFGCPVRTECLGEALDNRIEFGIWGGMTERERRALLRRRPEVRSWAELLEEAKGDYTESPVMSEIRFILASSEET